ncbi:MAG: PAS domain-containing protein, partial [Chloroflexi bacterium]|nr:PAS domain-containing protein [Chloroflexota bacterium]
MREAQKVAHIGSFRGDIYKDELWWSDELYHLFGLDSAQFIPTKDGFFELLHPEDKDEYIAILTDSLATGKELRKEYRAKHISGEWRHFETLASIILADNGEIVGLNGTVQDITERRRREESLRQLKQAMEQSPVSVMITDTAGVLQYVNPKFSQMTGYSAAELLGQNPGILPGEQTSEFYREMWDTLVVGQEWQGEFRNRKKNGELYWVSAS